MKDSHNLDLLRASAVCFVVLSHIPSFVDGLTASWYSMKALGHVGVAIFFVHTTLVLMNSLQRKSGGAAAFFVRRAFRIYPLSMTVVLLIALLKWLGGVPGEFQELLSNLLLIQNLTGARSTPDPLWTLPLEVQMYLLLPVLFAVTKTRAPVRWVALVLVGSAALALATGVWNTMTLASFAPCFLAGVLAFVLPPRHRTNSRLLWMMVSCGAAFVPTAVAAGAPEIPMLWFLCLALGLTIPQCRELASRPMANAAKIIATYSYGIYLTHVFAFGLAFTGGSPTLGDWAVFAVLLPSFAWVAYHAIEKPGLRAGIRIVGMMQGRRAAGMDIVAEDLQAEGRRT